MNPYTTNLYEIKDFNKEVESKKDHLDIYWLNYRNSVVGGTCHNFGNVNELMYFILRRFLTEGLSVIYLK